MNELSSKYPSFYLDLSSYLSKYGGESAPVVSQQTTIAEDSASEIDEDILLSENMQQKLNAESVFRALNASDVQALKNIMDQHSVPEVANIEEPSSGLSPLLYTLRQRPLQFPQVETIIQVLVSSGADLTVADPKTGKSALHFILEDSALLQETLIKDDAPGSRSRSLDRQKTRKESNTESFQLNESVLQLFKFLVSRGCDLTAQDNQGNYAIHYACKAGLLNVLCFLVIDCHVHLSVQNTAGQTPLDVCIDQDLKEYVFALVESRVSGKHSESDLFNHATQTSIEPLQRMQDLLFKTFQEASTALSAELSRELLNERLGAHVASVTFDSNSVVKISPQLLTESETKRDQLQSELSTLQDVSQLSLAKKDEEIMKLQQQLHDLAMLQDSTASLLKETQSENADKANQIEVLSAQHDLIKNSLARSSSLNVELSSKAEESEVQNRSKVLSLQARIQDLESLIHRKDEVLRQLSDTHRVLSKEASPIVDLVSVSASPRTPGDSAKAAQIDLHLDILRANLETITEDLKASTAALEKKREARVLENADIATLDVEERSTRHKSMRLRKEIASLETQISRKTQERDALFKPLESSSVDQSPARGFMHLEDLLGQLQLNTVELTPPFTPNGSPLKMDESPSRVGYRMSTVFNKEDVDVDPVLLNRLLDAAKRKIERLKSTVESLREESSLLKSQLNEKDIHIQESYGLLQSANKRAAEAENKASRQTSDQDKKLMQFERVLEQRRHELTHYQKIAVDFSGQTSTGNDETEALSGVIGALRRLILDLDPAILSQLPSHLLNSSMDGVLQVSDLPSDASLDTQHRFSAHLVNILSTSVSRIREFLDHIGRALSQMKGENKKFVKEIMKLKKAAVVQSLVTGVRDSVIEPYGPRSRLFNDIDYKRRSPRRVPAFPASSFTTTPQRPLRSRESTVSNMSTISETDSTRLNSSTMPTEAAGLLESLKKLKAEILAAEAQPDASSVEKKKNIDELKSQYRGSVKQLMSALKQQENSGPPAVTNGLKSMDGSPVRRASAEQLSPSVSKSQALKDRLRKMSSDLNEIRGTLSPTQS